MALGTLSAPAWLRGYVELMRLPGIPRLMVSVFPGRLAYGMIGLALFFHVHQQTGSIARAGLTIGAASLTAAIGSGIRGAIMDRHGQTVPLMVFVPLYVVVVTTSSFSSDRDLLLILAIIQGLVAPPINLSSRPLWKAAVGPERLRTAYALDSVAMNTTQVVGPTVATTVALGLGGANAMRLVAFCMLIGGTLMITMPLSRRWRPEERLEHEPGLLRSPAIRLLAIDGAIFGLGIGAFTVAVPAAATLAGRPGVTAPILSGMSLAGILGGLLAGAIARSITPLRGNLSAYVLIAIFFIPLPWTHPGWSMGVVVFLAGIFLGAGAVYHWEVVEAVRPRGAAIGALSWIWTVEGSMGAVGSALGGWLAEHQTPAAALALTPVMTSIGAALIYLRRDLLRAADRNASDEQLTEAIADTTGQ